jgi:hypothetical protein
MKKGAFLSVNALFGRVGASLGLNKADISRKIQWFYFLNPMDLSLESNGFDFEIQWI